MYHWPENSIKHSKTNKILSSKKLNSYKIDNHNVATKLATTAKKKASLINKLVHELADHFMFERFGLGWRIFVNCNQYEKWKDTFGENAFFGRFVREMSSYDTNFMRHDLRNGHIWTFSNQLESLNLVFMQANEINLVKVTCQVIWKNTISEFCWIDF